jgi:4-hydroxybenzoate polyprenyltransferase
MMNQIKAILKLVRWVNLLIIILSMFLFQYCVIGLYFHASNIIPTMSWPYFSLLVLATVLIAAAGNVANAYFDYEEDVEYKPETVVIGKYISLDTAFALQMVLNIAGVLLGFYLAYSYGNIRMGYVFLSVAALLWMYSQQLKKYFLVGNIVVAGLSAFVFVLPVLFEAHINDFFVNDNLELAKRIIITELKWYFLFAFLMSLVREIVKDTEDKLGDLAYGMKTLPVVLPRMMVNSIIVLLILSVAVLLGLLQMYFWQHGLKRHFWYILFFLQFPLLVNVFTGFVSKNKEDYHNLSILLKLVMFFGIASLPVFYYFIVQQNMPQ